MTYIIDLKNYYCINERFSKKDFFKIKHLLSNNEKIIFTAIEEKWPTELLNNFIHDFELKYDDPNVMLIVDRLTAVQPDFRINFKNILKFDSQLIKVASWEDVTFPNNTINLNASKFLFLMGKPYKSHRVGFLYQLYNEGIIDHCDYSFKLDNQYIESATRLQLPDINDLEFLKFKQKTLRNLDDVSFAITPSGCHYNGLPVDINLYKNTSFSIISESVCAVDEPWFLSEKTWRTLANRHMFLPLFDAATFDYVESLGITTFQDILPIKKDQYISDVDNIIANTIINIKYLLSNISKHQTYIEEGIENNYRVYKNLVAKSREIFSKELEHRLYATVYNELPYETIQKVDINLTNLFGPDTTN